MLRDCGGGYCFFFLPTPTHRQLMVADDGITRIYIPRLSTCKYVNVLAILLGQV